jgi:hypothetical protein
MIARNLLLTLFFLLITTVSSKAQNPSEIKNEFLPDIDGVLKTKVEYDLDNLLGRFEVRNARFGAKGRINKYFTYRAEIDLSDEGVLKMLDAWLGFSPVSGLNFFMGQKKIPFSSDYLRNPAENLFANRSFLAKYINEGMRDIGFYAEYAVQGNLPASISLSAVNGTGNNNPQWIEKPNFTGRFTIGPDKGFRTAANLYYGDNELRKKLAMFGAEARYSTGNFFIESEYICRKWTDTLSMRIHDDGLYLHSFYNFLFPEKMICLLTPVIRIDFMGTGILKGSTDASRLTLGVNFGFDPRQFQSELRLNYENYFKSSLPNHTDKITFEFVGKF